MLDLKEYLVVTNMHVYTFIQLQPADQKVVLQNQENEAHKAGAREWVQSRRGAGCLVVRSPPELSKGRIWPSIIGISKYKYFNKYKYLLSSTNTK